MAKVQDQNGSVVVSMPPMVAKLLGIKKGDYVDYDYNKETGKIEIFKISKDKTK